MLPVMTTLAVGTDKGLFCFAQRDGSWVPAEPQFLGWRVTALGRDGDGAYLAGTASGWYGPAIHRSDDLHDWQQLTPGPQFAPESGRKLKQIWRLVTIGDALWVGIAEAGLFRSADNGATWEPVAGLNDHPTSAAWMPGAGGLCAHALIAHPTDANRMWCGISAVGVFRTDDGGQTWELRNSGVRAVAPAEEHDIGYCVHGLVLDPDDPDRLYRQDHSGVYRTSDAADTWERIENGLPAGFGFPIVVDRSTHRLFVVRLDSDERRVPPGGQLSVYRSDDTGDSWQISGIGWPATPRWAGVLRGAMATDDAGTIVAGTTAGEIWISTDSGEHWDHIDVVLPRIYAVTLY
jgi:photosystem II stability/assembly factor-like uncharacterized protein